jgi:hypothetical protein
VPEGRGIQNTPKPEGRGIQRPLQAKANLPQPPKKSPSFFPIFSPTYQFFTIFVVYSPKK